MSGQPSVLVVTGLAAEARIAAGPGVVTVAGGGDAARLALLLRAALGRGAGAVVSFGIAGGLAPGLAPGAVLIASAVHDGADRLPADPAWTERLALLLPNARRCDLAGVDAAVAGPDDKAALRRRTGAAAVDMESHVTARLASLYGVPFAALRVVADPAERTLPPAALVGMRPDGTTDLGAVLGSLGRRPRQLPSLIRTGLDARAAFAALAASRRALGPAFDAAVAGGGAAPAAAPASASDPAASRVG